MGLFWHRHVCCIGIFSHIFTRTSFIADVDVDFVGVEFSTRHHETCWIGSQIRLTFWQVHLYSCVYIHTYIRMRFSRVTMRHVELDHKYVSYFDRYTYIYVYVHIHTYIHMSCPRVTMRLFGLDPRYVSHFDNYTYIYVYTYTRTYIWDFHASLWDTLK